MPKLPKWLPSVLAHIHTCAQAGRVHLTRKAIGEMHALGMGLDEQDIVEIIGALAPDDFFERLISTHTDEWMYVFKPLVFGVTLYVKVVLQQHCLVVSFHEDEAED